MRPLSLALAAVLLGCATAKPTPTHAEPLPFIVDDYEKARAAAKARNVPLFVDAWAPWCHTCLFMRSHVLNDPQLGKHADRYVWLELDTEKPSSAAFLEKYPVESWPTLFILEPSSGAVAYRWPGSATKEQLEKLLDDGEKAIAQQRATPLEAKLAQARSTYANRRYREAAEAFAQVLASAPADWPERARAVEELINAHWGAKTLDACAQVATRELPGLPRGPSFGNATAMALLCALQADAPERKDWLLGLVPLGRESVTLESILVDDRSSLYELLVDAHRALGDAGAATALAAEWLTFLEKHAQAAKTSKARATFDAHRVAAAIAAGTPRRALAPLLQSEQEFADDYNPPARLALVYLELGQLPDALAATDRALARVYGPRKLRVLETRARVLLAMRRVDEAKAALNEALQTNEALPEAQRSDRAAARIHAALKALPE